MTLCFFALGSVILSGQLNLGGSDPHAPAPAAGGDTCGAPNPAWQATKCNEKPGHRGNHRFTSADGHSTEWGAGWDPATAPIPF